MFYGNVDMHVDGLPAVVKVNIFVSKLQGQPRETRSEAQDRAWLLHK